MFEHFGDYMFYLLHAPLRKLKAGENQLKIFFSVVGEVFDGIQEDIFRLREQKMISMAEPIMLEVIGQDRDMFRLQGESIEAYRRRLQMKAVIAEMAGTAEGLKLALEMIGYPQCSVEPLYLTDRSRWAEIYIDVPVSHDINYDAILTETLKVKTARTLPHLRFAYTIRADEKVIAVGGIGGELKVKHISVRAFRRRQRTAYWRQDPCIRCCMQKFKEEHDGRSKQILFGCYGHRK